MDMRSFFYQSNNCSFSSYFDAVDFDPKSKQFTFVSVLYEFLSREMYSLMRIFVLVRHNSNESCSDSHLWDENKSVWEIELTLNSLEAVNECRLAWIMHDFAVWYPMIGHC